MLKYGGKHANEHSSHLVNKAHHICKQRGITNKPDSLRQMCSPGPTVQSAGAALPGWAEFAPEYSAPKSSG